MRVPLFFLSLLLAALLLKACKKDSDGSDNTNSEAGLLPIVLILDKAQDYFIAEAQQNGGSAYAALEATTAWLNTQADVEAADLIDDKLIMITLKSGMSIPFFLDFKDANGLSVYRGGGSGNSLSTLSSGGPCSNIMSNKEVLLYVAMNSAFYGPGELQNVKDLFANSSVQFNVTSLVDSQCTPQVVSTFGNYGLVVMSTHGFPGGFYSGLRLKLDSLDDTENEIKSAIEAQVGSGSSTRFLSREWGLGYGIDLDTTNLNWVNYLVKRRDFGVTVNSRYINTLPLWDETIIFGNMCYSGMGNVIPIKDPIAPAILARQPIAYYCYRRIDNEKAYPVENNFAKRMEDSLLKALVIDFDSTGNAHLDPTGSNYLDTAYCLQNGTVDRCNFFVQLGQKNFCYGCGDSITDPRDGAKYKTVCIGSQTWLAENLKYNASGSTCFQNTSSNCNIYGRLYTWSTMMNGESATTVNPSGVQGICPQGWHIPSTSEWNQLINYLGGPGIAGGKLKALTTWVSPNSGATNSSGFSALGSGAYNGINWVAFNETTWFWSCTENLSNPDDVETVYISAYSPVATINQFYKVANGGDPSLLPCRCVKD